MTTEKMDELLDILPDVVRACVIAYQKKNATPLKCYFVLQENDLGTSKEAVESLSKKQQNELEGDMLLVAVAFKKILPKLASVAKRIKKIEDKHCLKF